jgi:hypothetical protein
VTTTRRGTIIAPTRREVLMSLGALAIGIGAGPLDRFPTPPGQSGRSKALVAKAIWSPRLIRVQRIGTRGGLRHSFMGAVSSPRLRKSTDKACQTTESQASPLLCKSFDFHG